MSEEFECDVCGRSFDTKRGLSVHASQVHKGKKKTKKKETSKGTKARDVEFEVSPWKLVSGVLGVLLVITLVFVAQGSPMARDTEEDVIPPEEAADKALEFVNDYMMEPGMEDIEAEEVNERYGLYEIVILMEGMMGPQEHSMFVSQDGEILFPEAIDIEETADEIEAMQQMEEDMDDEEGEIFIEPGEEPEGEEEIVIEPEEVEE